MLWEGNAHQDRPDRALDQSRARALMVLGTASHVGKSLIAAAFCRLYAERGVRVAPFKAQNMALNSFVTRDGGEIGRAQVAQAEAAGIEQLVEMNPILLKPMGGVSQVVVEGSPIGVMSAREYYAAKDRLWPRVTAAYDRLAQDFDMIVLEGAGSPVEINLSEHDLTNLRMARYAEATIVLVADIERGGVFAQLVGTWELMAPEDRARVAGFIINKFRGDATLLDSGLEYLRERTGVPVLGVLPYRPDLQIDQEDSLGIDETASRVDDESYELDVAVPRLPGVSNFTDLWPLARVPGVRVRYVERGIDLGRPDLVVIPGSKTTVRDLNWLRQTGLAERLVSLASDERGPIVVGICGGFQMLGTRIDDPHGIESSEASVEGLGLLDVTTSFAAEKARHRVSGHAGDGGSPIRGYEIHMGETRRGEDAHPWITLIRERTGERIEDGAVDACNRVYGTYVHGLFDSVPFMISLIERLRARRGLPVLEARHWELHRQSTANRYAGLAALLHEHLDLSFLPMPERQTEACRGV
jgi:adenosylcobyric acid synthase